MTVPAQYYVAGLLALVGGAFAWWGRRNDHRWVADDDHDEADDEMTSEQWMHESEIAEQVRTVDLENISITGFDVRAEPAEVDLSAIRIDDLRVEAR